MYNKQHFIVHQSVMTVLTYPDVFFIIINLKYDLINCKTFCKIILLLTQFNVILYLICSTAELDFVLIVSA